MIKKESTKEIENLELENLSIIAIEELDRLISSLVRSRNASVSHRFLDWVADHLTLTVLTKLEIIAQTQRFKESLLLGNPRIAIAYWVNHWVCSEIKKHFPNYVSLCPCTQVVVLEVDKFYF
jgi:hypothetical protein